MNKGWKTQINKLETDLMTIGAKLGDLYPMKKLLDEKENTIQTLKKKLKIHFVEYPQT